MANYVFSKYSFPLPNNGDRYNFSEDELIKLLDSAYDKGYQHGRESMNIGVTTTASYEDKDDNTKWKEVWIK